MAYPANPEHASTSVKNSLGSGTGVQRSVQRARIGCGGTQAQALTGLGRIHARLSSAGWTGSLRRRLPVAAKIVCATAGMTAEVPGSPSPPAGSVFWTMCRSLVHAQQRPGVEVGLTAPAFFARIAFELPIEQRDPHLARTSAAQDGHESSINGNKRPRQRPRACGNFAVRRLESCRTRVERSCGQRDHCNVDGLDPCGNHTGARHARSLWPGSPCPRMVGLQRTTARLTRRGMQRDVSDGRPGTGRAPPAVNG